jgi:hypothetical protein
MCSGKRMRRIALTISIVACAGLAWVAAPALSLRPYTPKAVDFEQRLPKLKRLPQGRAHDVGHRHAGDRDDHAVEGPTFRSPTIDAPKQFDFVGIAGEMREVEFRVRDEGGAWSEWVEIGHGDPLYTGGSDEVQLRTDGFRPSGDLHYVNVNGTSGGIADRVLNGVRGAINDAFISVAATPIAEAKAPKPAFMTRAAWGADRTDGGGCTPTAPPVFGQPRVAVIHHTVSANGYAPADGPGIVLGICRFHVFGNGWSDIGYNALVDAHGQLYEGRAGGLRNPIVGAHTAGVNSQTTGLATIGTHSSLPITTAAKGTIVRYLAWKLGKHRIPARGLATLLSGATAPRISGHRQFNPTDCPGGALFAQLSSIRKQTQKRIKKYAKGRNKKGKRGKRR